MTNTNVTQEKNSIAMYAGVLIILLSIISVQSKAQSVKAKPWIAPASANALKNPYEGDASAAKDGKKIYTTYCAPCHGNTGRGDGIAAASVNPKPADHTSEAVQKEADGALYWKMTEGRGPMTSYKQVLTDKQRWELVCFIRTLARKK